jgi:probable HAF family extracellular repeat protein
VRGQLEKEAIVRNLIARFAPAAAVLLAGVAHGGDLGSSRREEPGKYQVTHLSSLGGTVSRGNSINDAGWVSGYSNLPGNQARHASLWLDGRQLDLGTLGGPNSSVAWPVKNDRGLIAGIAQTAAADPLGENWSCSAFFPAATATGHVCLGFVWKEGVMKALPTLGGNNGFATGANDHGQVAGWAENTVHDPTCLPPQVLQFRAVVWGPDEDQVRPLPPLPGDTSGAATAINDRGQVVGISGTCDQAVGRFTAAHAVLWEDGRVTDIGNLGGTTWNTPMAINQRGDVVGFASEPGTDPDNPRLHAFLWTRRDGIRDLGALPGDVYSEAHGINERRQVVGVSCDAAGNCRAFLWQDGVMTDLNALVAPGYTGLLTTAQDIDDRGAITGRAFDPGTGARPAFLATPPSDRR